MEYLTTCLYSTTLQYVFIIAHNIYAVKVQYPNNFQVHKLNGFKSKVRFQNQINLSGYLNPVMLFLIFFYLVYGVRAGLINYAFFRGGGGRMPSLPSLKSAPAYNYLHRTYF